MERYRPNPNKTPEGLDIPEGDKKETFFDKWKKTISTAVKVGGVLAGIALLATGAADKKTRKEVFKRDAGECQHCGLKWDDGWFLQVAHIDHDKKKKTYNDPENLKLLCVKCHVEDHIRLAKETGWVAPVSLLVDYVATFGLRTKRFYDRAEELRPGSASRIREIELWEFIGWFKRKCDQYNVPELKVLVKRYEEELSEKYGKWESPISFL